MIDPDESTTAVASSYAAPTIERLGTLAELTRGGTSGMDDGFGGTGDGARES